MKKYNWPFKKAIKFVRDKRPIVLPNLGFERQLKQYETLLQRESNTAEFNNRNYVQNSEKYSISPFKTNGLPNIKNLGQTSWVKSKVIERNINIKFELDSVNDF